MTTPNELEVKDYLQRFSIHLYAKCGFAETTVELLTGFIRRAAPIIGMNPTHIEVEGYLAYLRMTGMSYAMIANLITALNRYMEFLGSPILLKRPRKPRSLIISTLSEAEIAIIIAHAPTIREKAILTMLAYSGMRNQELCSLLIRDLEISTQMVIIETAKGQAKRKICISGRCLEVLSEYMKTRNSGPDSLLFVTVRHHHKLDTQDLRKIIRVSAKRANIKKRVYPHIFRHSLATNMLHRGANLLTIKEQLGHAYIETTMIYLHSTQERLQADYRSFSPSYL